MPSLTLALSGGGAAGLGHIPVLEALDDAGARPEAIAGTSIGALIGAAFAAGLSGAAIRALVEDRARDPMKTMRRYIRKSGVSLTDVFKPLAPGEALDLLLPENFPARFEDLDIPLTVVATDYHARAEKRFTTGALRPALAASMAIPGLFWPVRIDGRLYVDGGVTNNLPLDALPDGDVCLAVDVASLPTEDGDDPPGPLAATTGAMRIMLCALMEQRLESHPPDILIRPESRCFGPVDFQKARDILAAAEPARRETRDALKAHGIG